MEKEVKSGRKMKVRRHPLAALPSGVGNGEVVCKGGGDARWRGYTFEPMIMLF